MILKPAAAAREQALAGTEYRPSTGDGAQVESGPSARHCGAATNSRTTRATAVRGIHRLKSSVEEGKQKDREQQAIVIQISTHHRIRQRRQDDDRQEQTRPTILP